MIKSFDKVRWSAEPTVRSHVLKIERINACSLFRFYNETEMLIMPRNVACVCLSVASSIKVKCRHQTSIFSVYRISNVGHVGGGGVCMNIGF